MKKIEKLFKIGLAVLFMLSMSVSLVGCSENGGESKVSISDDDSKVSISDDESKVSICKHNVGSDGVCTVCEEYIPTNGVVYQISVDGQSAEVCGYEGTDRFVVIAKEYNGLPVKTVASWAFQDCDNVSHVVLSDSITTLNDWAFSSCSNMTSIVLGENITTIENFAFSACFRLVEIYNKSSLSITENGEFAYYVKNIYTNPTGSKLVTDENGYVIYSDGEKKELISYMGTETNLILPEKYNKN